MKYNIKLLYVGVIADEYSDSNFYGLHTALFVRDYGNFEATLSLFMKSKSFHK